MKEQKLYSPDKTKMLDQDTIKMLFCKVFPHMSNLVIFNLAFFCVSECTDADNQFRDALNQELFRRGLATTPDVYNRDVNVDKFSDDDVESVNMWFAGNGDPDGHTHEDYYVKLFTGRDRWAERKRKRRVSRKAAKSRQ